MKKRIRPIARVFVLVGCLGACFFVRAQDVPKGGESQLRQRLKERLDTFLDFQKKGNYRELYEMLAFEQRNASNKDAFVRIYQKSSEKNEQSLTGFVVREWGLLQPSNGFAFIFGCGEYKEGKKTQYYESDVEAVYENADWYFDSLIGASVGFGTPFKKCNTLTLPMKK